MVNESQKQLLESIKNRRDFVGKQELIVELLEMLVNTNTNQMQAWKEFHEDIKSTKGEYVNVTND